MLKKSLCVSILFILITTAITANPNTMNGMLRNLVFGEDLSKPMPLANEESPAVKILTEFATPEIISQVHQYVQGTILLERMEITKENHSQYLAAAKIVDLVTPIENQQNSTFQIRYTALKKSDGIMGIPLFNTIVNAFAMPSADEKDPFLLNGLDHKHLSLQKMDPQRLSQYRLVMDAYVQKQVNFHPDFLKTVHKVIGVFAQNIENLQTLISPARVIYYCGVTGAGKTTAMKESMGDVNAYIASTDNIVKAFSLKFNKDFSNDHLNYLSFSLRKEFESIIKEKYTTLSLIQEAWLIHPVEIEKLFNNTLPVEMHDFDGDLRILSLRAILRARSPDGRPTFPWNQMTRAFQLSRQHRPLIWKSLKNKDSYDLQYSYNDGTVKIYSLEETQNLFQNDLKIPVDEEIQTVTQSLITKNDVLQFGEALQEFEGLTISQAFEKAQHPVPSKQKRFTVLFTNDMHSHLEKIQQIAHQILIEKQNPENGEVIVADDGDMLTGTEYFDVSKGILEFELMNIAGYNIATIGNHEFDAGWANLKQVLQTASFDVINANIYDIETNQLIAEPYKILTVGSLKVAFVGIIGRDAWKSIRPSAKEGLEIHDPDAVLDELLPKLEADVIILLSHSGITSDREYAAKHIHLDAILGGHSHTYMTQPELIQVSGTGKFIPVFQASKFGDYLGKLTFDISNNKKSHQAQLIKIDPSQDPKKPLSFNEELINRKLKAVSEKIEEIYSRVISTCLQPLSREGIAKKILPIGRDFICHLIKEITQTDAAFYPSKGIHIGFEKGPITVKTIIHMLQPDTIVTYKASGAWLRQLMKAGELRWPARQRTFQTNGIEIDPVTQEVTINGKPLQDTLVYRVSGPSFFFEREFLENHAGWVDKDYEEQPDDVRAIVINWMENNDFLPYFRKG